MYLHFKGDFNLLLKKLILLTHFKCFLLLKIKLTLIISKSK